MEFICDVGAGASDERLINDAGRLPSDYRKIMGRQQEDDRKSAVRFRLGFTKSDGTFSRSLCPREASAKPAWSNFHAPLKPSHVPSPEAQCLFPPVIAPWHGLNWIQLHESANVRDVCGTSIREARRSPAKPLREATVLPRSLAKPSGPAQPPA